MIILLSPSKTMDSETPVPLEVNDTAYFLNEASGLVDSLKQLPLKELKSLLGVSDKLAQLNFDRYKAWTPDHTPSNSRSAIYTFKGDAYVGLDGFSLRPEELIDAQQRLLILSGLYGVLRPKDLMQPYRLEMGGAFVPDGSKSMLDFWKPRITAYLKDAVSNTPNPWIMNLASTEYSNAIDFKSLAVPVISPRFLEDRSGKLKMISSFAKKARGLMTRWLIVNGHDDMEGITGFDTEGYRFSSGQSTPEQPTFIR